MAFRSGKNSRFLLRLPASISRIATTLKPGCSGRRGRLPPNQIEEEKYSMNKKLMALAVAGAFGVPAAAVGQVEIYGRANVFMDSYQATGATAANSDFKSRTRVNDQGSRLGVRGREDLGRGLRAVYQIESGVNLDTGSNQTSSPGGPTNALASTFATRDSWVG